MKKSSILWYALAVPAAALASTAFAMSLQPVIDRGMSGDRAAFVHASLWALLCAVLDNIGTYLENVRRVKLVNEFGRQLRVRYFKGFFRLPPWQFAGKDSACYLTKLTADAEAVSEKYCGSVLRIYKAVWSLVISIAVIAFTRWELAVYVFVFSFLSVNLPKLFQKEAVSAEQDYLNSSNIHMAQAQESIRNYLLIQLHGLADSRVAKYEAAAACVEKTDTVRQKKYFAMDMAAGGISSFSFVLIIVFAMILVIQGKLSVGYTMSVSQLLGGIMVPFEVLPGYLLAFRAGRELYRAGEAEFGDGRVQEAEPEGAGQEAESAFGAEQEAESGNGRMQEAEPGSAGQEAESGNGRMQEAEPGSAGQEAESGNGRMQEAEPGSAEQEAGSGDGRVQEAEPEGAEQEAESGDGRMQEAEPGDGRMQKTGPEGGRKQKAEPGDGRMQKAKPGCGRAVCTQPGDGLLRIVGLNFAYRDAAPLLKGVSLSVRMNRKYALVGASGSGKSTLSKLIMGFLPVEDGKISVNGISLEKIRRESLYEMISYQSQSVTFFQDTLRNNICLGAQLSEKELKQAIKAACLETFVSALPEGVESVIREDGKNLSGGEAQRIGLARSLAKGCRFMIFDEIAASLDNQTALEVEKTILALPDVGMLMITHRIFEENMRLYDGIFVLKEGRISEAGNWEQLMERRGDFYRLIT